MKYFCTYFDKNFIYQGLALYESLCKHAGEFKLWILCFDDKSFQLIKAMNKKEVIPLSNKELESTYPQLLSVKVERSLVEYYWTTTPFLPRFIFKNHQGVGSIAYLDADLFFFYSLEPIYQEWGDGSIFLVPHRFSPENQKRGEREAGQYNVGFVGFKNDDTGLLALNRWCEQNIDWCYDRIEHGRMGDQAYLHDWADRYPDVVVSKNIGVGAGGWNIMNYKINWDNGNLSLDHNNVIMLHMNFVKVVNDLFVIGMPRRRFYKIYKVYSSYLKTARYWVKIIDPDFSSNNQSIINIYMLYAFIRGGVVKI